MWFLKSFVFRKKNAQLSCCIDVSSRASLSQRHVLPYLLQRLWHMSRSPLLPWYMRTKVTWRSPCSLNWLPLISIPVTLRSGFDWRKCPWSKTILSRLFFATRKVMRINPHFEYMFHNRCLVIALAAVGVMLVEMCLFCTVWFNQDTWVYLFLAYQQLYLTLSWCSTEVGRRTEPLVSHCGILVLSSSLKIQVGFE